MPRTLPIDPPLAGARAPRGAGAPRLWGTVFLSVAAFWAVTFATVISSFGAGPSTLISPVAISGLPAMGTAMYHEVAATRPGTAP